MKINFTKMHGIGNDYIYVNCIEKELESPDKLSVEMSRRRFSVGSDGLVLICRSEIADAKMRIFNADGSEAQMCGNATRCVGKYLYEKGIVKKDTISVETLSGIKYLSLSVENGIVSSVRVDMGYAVFAPDKIPVLTPAEAIQQRMTVSGKDYRFTAVSMGNPHSVIYLDEIDTLPLEAIGPYFENHELFPERTNTEFVKILSPDHLKMRVWERGSGETYACGTGACAVVAASVKNGISPSGTKVKVSLRGGDLIIECMDDYRIYMTGPAAISYEGTYEI